MKRTLISLLMCTAAALAGAQQPPAQQPSSQPNVIKLEREDRTTPQFTNAKLRALALSGTLQSAVESAGRSSNVVWLGYAVPIVQTPRFICCADDWSDFKRIDGCCTGCKLERRQGSYFHSTGGACVKPEPPSHAFILLRLQGGVVQKVRSFTPDCPLDAGGMPVVWLTGVSEPESLRYLAGLARQGAPENRRSFRDEALHAIAIHRDAQATRMLEEFLAGAGSNKAKEHAGFLLAQERGREGFEVIRKYTQTSPDADLREKLTFALSQSEEPGAVHELLRMAKSDASGKVRSQAIFWLAEEAKRQAKDAITDAVENDPDTQVKKKAVFALSQMPKEEGVPLLIKYAKSHRNPIVRKEAIFWLGQSEDPRAIDVLEEMLLGKKQ